MLTAGVSFMVFDMVLLALSKCVMEESLFLWDCKFIAKIRSFEF